MEENYINELDKEYKKSRWLRGGSGREARDMSGSSHSSDSHGVYSAYSYTGATTVFSPLSCENTSDYQQMDSSRRREKNSAKLKEDNTSDHGSPKSAMESVHKNLREMAHFRTKSDVTPTASSGSGARASGGRAFSLSRSKSIASARDKWKLSTSYGLLPFLSRDNSKNNLHEGSEKSSEEYLNKELESLQVRFNTESQERQRLEREVDRFSKLYDQTQDELQDLRDEHAQLLSCSGGGAAGESLSLMYGNLLRKYEARRDECDKLLVARNEAANQAEAVQEQLKQYKSSFENMVNERNKYKQQCTQAIRQWDQALVEKNQLKSELDQAMNIRIKASKDIKRLTEERNSALHEYSVIMSERDSVHKEMEKLQEEIQSNGAMSKKIELLQIEIRAALSDRDSAMKDLHEMRRKYEDKENVNPSGEGKGEEEINKLLKEKQELEERLQNTVMEADVAKGRRDWAFEERDKIMLESEGVQALCDKLRKERDKAVTDLIDKMKELNDLKNQQTKTNNQNVDNEPNSVITRNSKDIPQPKIALRKETDEKRTDFVTKMIQKAECDTRPAPTVSKLFTSSERVYCLSSTPTQGRELKKPWTHFKENVKEKLDLVKGRRQSVEQCEEEERGEKIKSGELKESEAMMKTSQNPSRKPSESDSEFMDGESQKRYSLHQLDSKIMEIKQNFAAPQTPVSSNRSKFLHHIYNPQDVVQSHYLQVQSRIQDALASKKPVSAAGSKDDYFLASSASETSLNESLKSGNLDEHEVMYQTEPDKSLEDHAGSDDKQSGGGQALHKPWPSYPHHHQHSASVTSPKRTSPFPHLKPGEFPPPAAAPYTSMFQPPGLRSPNSNIYSVYTGQAGYGLGYSSLPPEVSRYVYPAPAPAQAAREHKRLSLVGGRFGSGEQEAAEDKLPPAPGDIRQFHIDKSGEQLGIKIEEVSVAGDTAGIFISRVSLDSLAARVGLRVGDQLLEVCGINLRTAKYTQAAQVLHRAGKSVDIKVQYNPDKFELGDSSQSAESLYGYCAGAAVSGSPVYSPGAAPLPLYKSTPIRAESQPQDQEPLAAAALSPEADMFNLPKSKSSTLKSALNLHPSEEYSSQPNIDTYMCRGDGDTLKYSKELMSRYEPRLLRPVLNKTGVLGVRLVGGNAVGIFIHSIEQNSPANDVGLQRGDQILEYNGIDLRHATAEQAAYELAQPVQEHVSILAVFRPELYREVKDAPGDSYYIRAMFDRAAAECQALGQGQQLAFSSGDILWVDNTIYSGVPGNWSAWLLDKDGNKVKWGLIPSKYKVEETLRKRNKGKSFSDGVYEFSNSTRRSLLRRIKGGEAAAAGSVAPGAAEGDCRELAVYSELELRQEAEQSRAANYLLSYLRLDKRNSHCVRPVLILGPFSSRIIEKLSLDHPSKFVQCLPEYMNSDLKTVEKGLQDNIFIDFRRRGSHFECTTLRSVKEIIANNQHSFLDVSIGAVARLQQSHIYPIVVLIKFKSAKQLKEVNLWDPRAGLATQDTQLGVKDAKNLHEHSVKLEEEHGHLISDVVHAGSNIMLLCAQVASKIDLEQKRPIWIPSGTIW